MRRPQVFLPLRLGTLLATILSAMELKGETISPLRKARHDLRGRLNGLKLCVSALSTCESPAETIEFLDHIEQATDKIVKALDEYEALLEKEG